MSAKRTAEWLVVLLIVGCGISMEGIAWAQVCKPTTPESLQVKLQYLRRLSIDLRGQLPTIEESQKVIQTGQIPKDLLDSWLKKETIYAQLKTYHKDLLWANVSAISFDNEWRLNRGGKDGKPLYSSYTDRGDDNTACLDEPAELNSDGTFKFKPDGTDPKIKREGYVKVKPYWAPNTEIKVCGLESKKCGPNLQYCQGEVFDTHKTITKALIDQTLLFADSIIRSDRPYTDLIQSRSTVINGPVAHLMKYQAHTVDDIKIDKVYDKVPDLAFSNDKWQKFEVSKRHAGILTMPFYLMKNGSNRGRANTFYVKFLCKPFQAPPGGLPPGNDSCHNEPNLMKRCGCKYCHQTVEPAAAYWGRWLQSNLAFLDPKTYPAFSDDCLNSRNRDAKCKLYTQKVTHPDQEEFRGHLKSYLYATEKMKKNIELGPQGLAKEAIDSNSFSRCATSNAWKWFVGDPAPSPELLDTLAQSFRDNKYNFRKLLKEILKHPAYSQGRLYHLNYKK